MTDEQITELDAETVERIAAGEVVERPASAVKELVENSIDADASRVHVAVEAGGRELIRVSDDGIGMGESAVRRAVEKHTTSKIADIADLERGVATLGFRGEALHAIGAVSRMTITTRPRDGDRGTELTVEGGEVTDVSPAGCPAGTAVEVEDLFYNVPARRKYLKQDATEFAHVNTVVTNYALANPDVAVTLEHDGRETFATTGSGDLRETTMAVYGREVAESMIELDGGDLPDGPLAGVSGLVSHPETNRASREYLSTFVNGRYVRASTVREAIDEAYGGQLAADRYPFAVVFLEVDPGTVDVNVHPRKLNVRFADEAGLREQVRSVVEAALLEEGLLRTSAPRGRSATEQTEIRPGDVRDGEAGTGAVDRDTPAGGKETRNGGDTPVDESTAEAASGDPQTGLAGESDASESGTSHQTAYHSDEADAGDASVADDPADRRKEDANTGGGTTRRLADRTGTPAGSPQTDSTPGSPVDSPAGSSTAGGHSGSTAGDGSDRGEGEREVRKFRGATDQRRFDDATDDATGFDSLPAMRVLGQLHETYVVAETATGLVLVDQHAADERINYERLQSQFAGDTTTQALAEPVDVGLTAREAAAFDAYRDALAQLGFHADRVDDRTVRVTTLPAVVADVAGPELIRDVLADIIGDESAADRTVEALADEVLADMACHPSITGNTSLTEGSIVDLLTELDACENPWACPHGRPVVIHLETDEIADRFERDYPGH